MFFLVRFSLYSMLPSFPYTTCVLFVYVIFADKKTDSLSDRPSETNTVCIKDLDKLNLIMWLAKEPNVVKLDKWLFTLAELHQNSTLSSNDKKANLLKWDKLLFPLNSTKSWQYLLIFGKWLFPLLIFR